MRPQQDKVCKWSVLLPPAAPKIENKSAFSRTSTSGCFKQRVVPFPKTISRIEKCSSVIGRSKKSRKWGNHRLSEGPKDKKQQGDVG